MFHDLVVGVVRRPNSVDDLAVSGTGRYVRILCQERGLPDFGYSLWEFAVYGTAAPTGDLAKNRPATASSVEADAAHLAPGSTPGSWLVRMPSVKGSIKLYALAKDSAGNLVAATTSVALLPAR